MDMKVGAMDSQQVKMPPTEISLDITVTAVSPEGDISYDVVVNDAVARELRNAGIDVISTEEIFREYPEPPESYRIELDNHPTKLAAERIATFLQRRLR